MCVRDSQLGSMRIDLVRGQERRSATETEAAEIDFMNIKQLWGRYQDKAAQVDVCCGGWLQRRTHKTTILRQISKRLESKIILPS